MNEQSNDIWPMNLYHDIIGKPAEGCTMNYPKDVFGSLLYIMYAFLSFKEIVALLEFYRDQFTLSEMEKSMLTTRDEVKSLLRKGLRKLRAPSRARFLLLGVQGVVRNAFEEGREDGYNTGYHDGHQVCEINLLLQDKAEQERWERIQKTFPQQVNLLLISARAKNALLAAGIIYTVDLLSLTEQQFASIRGIGEKTVSETVQYFKDRGFSFKQEYSPIGLKREVRKK